MSKPMSHKKLPLSTLFLIIGSATLIGAILLGGVLPHYLNIKKTKDKIVSKQILLNRQTELFPLFAQAKSLSNQSFVPKLPNPEREPLNRNKIINLSNVFDRLAIKNDLTLINNSLDIGLLTDASDEIIVELSLSGNLFNFRKYIISLIELPFFSSIDALKIKADQGEMKQTSIKININIGKKL